MHDSAEHAAKTLFATHYHELTELASRLPGARNYRIRVAESAGSIAFLFQLEEGFASKSYGIEVARLAGVSPEVLQRAKEVLCKLEEIEFDILKTENPDDISYASLGGTTRSISNGEQVAFSKAKRNKLAAQVTLFQAANDNLIEQLRDLDIDALNPVETVALLKSLRDRLV